jgi:hypothetical protein
MKKSFLTILIQVVAVNFFYGQRAIVPSESTELCPLVNNTFTVTIPRIATQTNITVTAVGTSTVVAGATGVTSEGESTTFSFIGRFSDDNVTQSFRIDFTRSSTNGAAVENFNFRRIKSLKLSSIPSLINTNLPEIVAAPCEITTHNLSFNNIRFGNNQDATVPAFGNPITQYEYLLPIGWQLGSTTSTGSWIVANNSVVITSDLGTGGKHPTNPILAIPFSSVIFAKRVRNEKY